MTFGSPLLQADGTYLRSPIMSTNSYMRWLAYGYPGYTVDEDADSIMNFDPTGYGSIFTSPAVSRSSLPGTSTRPRSPLPAPARREVGSPLSPEPPDGARPPAGRRRVAGNNPTDRAVKLRTTRHAEVVKPL